MTPADLRPLFAATGWLATTPEAFRRAVLDRAVPRRYAAGDNLHWEGDDSRGMYGIAKGTIRLMLSAVEHGPYCGHLMHPGQWAGDSPAIAGSPRPVSLISAGSSTVVFLSRTAIGEMATRDPECWRHFAGSMAHSLSTAFGAIADLMLRDHRKRLVAVLLRIAGARSEMPPIERRIEVDVSQSDLAAMSNVTRSTVAATLQRLEDAGLIDVGYRRIVIRSVTGLRGLLAEG
jgi:CRP-like cAMP-binding protein